MRSVAVIELERDAPPPAEPPLRLAPRWRRRLSLAVAGVASATVLVAAAPVAGSRLVEVARVDATVSTLRIAGSTLLAVTLNGTPHLNGYQLTDGVRRWSVPLPPSSGSVQVGLFSIDVVDGVALVTAEGDQGTVLAVDIATGQELWQRGVPGLLNVSAPHAIVVGSYQRTITVGEAVGPVAGDPSRLVLRAIAVHTGQQLWEYEAPVDSWVALPYGTDGVDAASTFVVGSPDGRATTVDLATGDTVTSGQVAPIATTPAGQADGQQPRYAISGDQLLLVAAGSVTAYRLSTLTRAWTLARPNANASLFDCGRWLCFDDGATLQAFTRDTGAPAWSMPSNAAQSELGALRQWIYRAPTPGNPGDASLFDPVTQRIVLDLGEWRVDAYTGAGGVLLRWAGERPGVTWLGLLTDKPGIDPLGAVTALGQQPCQLAGTYLACVTIHGDVQIWRYRP